MGKKIKALFAVVLGLLMSLCFFACGKAELSLSKSNANMTVGESMTLTAESSKGGDVTWTSDNASVVVVEDGVLTATGAGQAKVTVSADGVSKTITITVRAAKEYVVTVDGVAQTVVKGEKAEKPADPTKEADAQYTYTFKGWYIKGTDKAWDFATPVEEALVIESRFDKTVNEYDVAFGNEAATAYAYGSLLTAPTAPTKEATAQYSYTFDGWYVAGTDKEWNFATDKVTEAVNLEARFSETLRTYAVTVNGVLSYANYGATVSAPEYVPTKASTATTVYTFDKWVIAGTTTAWNFATDVVTGNVNIEPAFTESARKFDIVYLVDGAEYKKTTGVTNGATVTAPAAPTKAATASTEYTFNGWMIAGTNTAFDFTAKFDANAVAGETLTLVASFTGKTREYTVTLKNGNSTSTLKVAYGATAKLPELTKEDAENVYIFNGWYTADGDKFVAATTAITANITLTAGWTAQPKYYTVSYYDESGAFLSSVNVKGGATVSAYANAPSKNQTVSTVYTFAEWVTADGLAYDFANAVNADIKLYASYTATVRQYDVTLMDGDKVFGVVKVDYDTNFSYDVNAEVPVYDVVGQYFVAWGANGSDVAYTGKVLADMTLYAITGIDTNTYTVTVKVEGSADVVLAGLYRNDKVNYGIVTAPATANTAATKNVLVGWTLEGTNNVYGPNDTLRCPENGGTFVAIFEEQYIYYNVALTLTTEEYTIVDENGVALTADYFTGKKWGDVVKFKVQKNSVETYGTAVVKSGTSTLPASGDLYNVTVIGDTMLTVSGLGIREYAIAGTATVLARQSNIDWAKTVTNASDAVVKLTKNGEVSYLDVINNDGTYTISGLRAGDYTVEFAYENAGGEMVVISDKYTKTLNYAFDANDDGAETWTVGNTNIGTIQFHATNTSYVLGANGSINQTTIAGVQSKDCTAVIYDQFKPGNSDFAATFSMNQDTARQSQWADGAQEVCPTFGLTFWTKSGGTPVSFYIYAEGKLRLAVDGKYIAEVNDKGLVCSTGGIFGRSGWGDAYRDVEYVVVRKGDFIGVYLTAYNATNANIKPVREKLVLSVDLSTGIVTTAEQMTGKSNEYPTSTGNKFTSTQPLIAEVFNNVQLVEIGWGTTNACAVNFYGLNYTYNEDVIDYYAGAKTYEGTMTVGGDKIVDAVEFISDAGLSYKTYTNANGHYTITLPKGDYTAVYGGIKSLTYKTDVVIDGDKTLEAVDLDYGFRGQTFTVGTANHVTKPEPEVTIIHDETKNNQFNNVVIKQPNINSTIVWSQPLAEVSAWGYTLEIPSNFAMYNNTDEPYDNDVYLKLYIGGLGSEYAIGMNSAGGPIGMTAPNGNFFQTVTKGSWSNWKDQVSGGGARPFQMMFVRKNARLEMYIKYPEMDTWFYAGYKDGAVAASGDVFFRTYHSGRSGNGTCVIDYTIRDFFYYEGNDNVSAIATESTDTVTLSANKATAGFNEVVTVTATPVSKQAVTAYVINGKTYPVPAGQNTYTFPALGYNADYTVTAITESTANYVALTGTVSFARAGYVSYYSLATGTVTATDANGKQYKGNIVNGAYSINLPAGSYTLFATTGKMIGDATATVNGATTANIVLDAFEEEAYENIAGGGLYVREDGSLGHKYYGATQENAWTGVTFTPNKEILEYGFTIKGNMSGARYPFIGGFVKEVNANRGGKFVGGAGSGDQAYFMSTDDYRGRFAVSGSPWVQWKGGFVCGQEDNSWDASGTYYANSYLELDFKIRVDGHNISMWLKGYNRQGGGVAGQINHADWVHCYTINIYDRYQQVKDNWAFGFTQAQIDAGEAQKYSYYLENTLYRVDQPCYFGPSVRVDTFVGHYGAPTVHGLWFEITQK